MSRSRYRPSRQRRRWYEKRMLAQRAAQKSVDVDYYRAYEAEQKFDARIPIESIDQEALLDVAWEALAPPIPPFGGAWRFASSWNVVPSPNATVHMMTMVFVAPTRVATPRGRLDRFLSRSRRPKSCEATP